MTNDLLRRRAGGAWREAWCRDPPGLSVLQGLVGLQNPGDRGSEKIYARTGPDGADEETVWPR
jgi:hypothetical protein